MAGRNSIYPNLESFGLKRKETIGPRAKKKSDTEIETI